MCTKNNYFIKKYLINHEYINYEPINYELINYSNPGTKIHILITRYKETDISIILKPFINKKDTTIFIYNKGNDIPLGIPNNTENLKIIQIPNLGWDAYGFLYHIINNYDNLSEYIIFLPGSCDVNYKLLKSKNLINHIEYYKELVNICTYTDSVKEKFYNFKINYKIIISSFRFKYSGNDP
jgi:hypothetical protein